MSLVDVASKALNLIQNVGSAAVNSAYPDDFELYMCAFELVAAKSNKTLSYFVFPVMPESFSDEVSFNNNIKKTSAGITAISSPNFIPHDISLTGTFGRGFKVLIGDTFSNMTNYIEGLPLGDKLKKIIGSFDNKVKTGYGTTKVLEDLMQQSKVVDELGPRILYFYNPSFNQKFIVKPTSLRFSQEVGSNNMIWRYNLTLKALAPSDSISRSGSNFNDNVSLSADYVAQNIANKALNAIESSIGYYGVKTLYSVARSGLKLEDIKSGNLSNIFNNFLNKENNG